MKKIYMKIFTIILLVSFMTSPVIAQTGRASVRIVHLAPFAEDARVTISLDGEDILTEFDYGGSTLYIDGLRPGNHTITVTPFGATDPVLETTINLAQPAPYTVLAIGDIENQPLDLLVLEDDNTAPAAGNFKLRLGHLAPFADTLPGTTVDIRTDDDSIILMDDVVFGEVDAFVEWPAGEYDLKITTSDGSKTLINLAPVTFTEGQIISVFAVGNGTIKPLGGYALPSDALGYFLDLEAIDARLQVAHLAPFGVPGTVDISLNEVPVPALQDFNYGDSTPYIDLPGGSYLVEIFPDNSDLAVIVKTVDLEAGKDYTAIAIGDEATGETAFDLLVLEDDNTAPAAGNFKLRLGHLAPFADTLAGTLADVRLDDGTLILDDVDFGDVAPYLELEEGEYDLKITSSDGETTLINLAPITFTDGQILSAFAVGNGTIQSLGGYALPSDAEGFFLPLEMARLQVAHLAPFADPGTVDIKLNGVTALPDFDYGESTAYIDLPAITYLVEVVPDGNMTAAITETVDLTDGGDYTAIAIGDEATGATALDLLVLEDDNTEPTAGYFKLRLGHLAPFADTLAGTRADVRLDDGTLILDDVDFGDVAPYLELEEGEYDLKITTPDGETTLINLAPVTFTDGQILSAFAVGNGTIQSLGGYALPSDAEGFFLPLEMARLQVAHLAPFADPGTVDIKLNGVTALPDFDYGESTAYIDLPAITYLVEVVPDGSMTAAITETVDLTDGGDYTAIAIGDEATGATALDLLVLEDDNTDPTAGYFKLRLGHLAPFADTLAGTLADVRLDDGTLILDDVDFGDVAPYLELEEGEYDLKITTPDGETTLINLAPVTFTDGQILSAFAVGNGTIQSLGGYALPSDAEGFFLPLEDEGFRYFFPLFLN